MADMKMEAEIIFEPHVPRALRLALEYAGDDGFVASMPQLLHARTHADYDNIIWNTWFTSYSEESVVTTPQSCRGCHPWRRHICLAGALRAGVPGKRRPIQYRRFYRPVRRQDLAKGSA
jgi:hypothetical protein